MIMQDILPSSKSKLLHNEYFVETKVKYDSLVCNERFGGKIESTTKLPIVMIIDPKIHGFTLPDDFKPELIANVLIKSPENQFIEGNLRFDNLMKNQIHVSTLQAGFLYSIDSSVESDKLDSSLKSQLVHVNRTPNELKIVDEESKGPEFDTPFGFKEKDEGNEKA